MDIAVIFEWFPAILLVLNAKKRLFSLPSVWKQAGGRIAKRRRRAMDQTGAGGGPESARY
ncbi:MAG: hypothetical protein M2R45_01483 [Verrucomicrobia subdivision 3 bacterium]|nr:hypothetical protein [Limisphaerales bacterium]MCS1413387.1 hypothetical protein [Limisphaerales bacterium]